MRTVLPPPWSPVPSVSGVTVEGGMDGVAILSHGAVRNCTFRPGQSLGAAAPPFPYRTCGSVQPPGIGFEVELLASSLLGLVAQI